MEDEDITADLINESDDGDGRQDKRFINLSQKVKQTAEERDKAQKNEEKARAEALAAKKEVEFYKGFSAVTSKYSNAADYQEKILEKVNAGYDIEDAAISILAKEGKLTAPVAPRPDSPAGGSAPTALKGGGDKTISEMNQEERRKVLEESLGFN